MRSRLTRYLGILCGALLALAVAGGAQAASLLERAEAGETIRIGYSNEAPFAYQNDEGELDGFVNVAGLAVLEKMGVTNIEGVLTEWGSLIPGLNAGRFDIITAGMYVLPKRCEQVAFTEPMGVFAEAFLVKKGNPLDLHSFEDVRDNPDAILVTGAGYSTVDHAKRIGIPEERIMQVPDLAAVLQAVKSGRAHAASATVFAMKELVAKGGGDVELATPFHAPEFTKGYSAYAFRKRNSDFRDAFNEVLADIVGTPRFMKLVAPYGYGESEVPDGSVSTAKLCKG